MFRFCLNLSAANINKNTQRLKFVVLNMDRLMRGKCMIFCSFLHD